MYQLILAKPRGYAEILQEKQITFAFANLNENKSTISEVFYPVKCRDFLGDCLFAEETGGKVQIYGFVFDPSIQKLDKDETRFVIKFADTDTKELFVNNLEILKTIEEMIGVSKTNLTELNKLTLFSEGDKFWMRTIFLISFYSFIFKALCYEYKDKRNWLEELEKLTPPTVDSSYARRVSSNKIWKILINLEKILTPYEGTSGTKENAIHHIHDYTGFVSVFGTPANKKHFDNIYSDRIMEICK